MHFFQAFCALDMLILFIWLLLCHLVASKVQNHILDLNLTHS